MRQLILIAVLCFLSGWTAADFELKDPALIVEEAFENPAAAEAADYAVEGAGVRSCGSYRADRKKNGPAHYVNLNWAKGFITGVSHIHVEALGKSQLGTGLDLDALTLWIDSYCISHPRDTLADASAALANELMN